MSRRSLGLAAMVAGALMSLAGVGGLVTGAGAPPDGAGPTSEAQEGPDTDPSPAPEESPSEPQEDEPSAREVVKAFVVDLSLAIRTGDDPRFLFASLHPAVIELYGPRSCRAAMRQFEDPTSRLRVKKVGPLEPWDWEVDDRAIPIQDVYAVEVARVSNGERADVEIHLGAVDTGIGWFTDCGDPLT